MAPLDELSIPVPRPEPLCKRYARRLDPWWGFVVAGTIWTVVAMVVTMLAMMKVSDRLGYEDGSRGAQVLAVISLVGAATFTIVTFRWWRTRRLASKATLIREGALRVMTVTGRPFRLGRSTSTAVDLEGGDRTLRCVFNRWFAPLTGETIKVLHHPAVPHLIAFDRTGSMYSGHVRSGQVDAAG